MKKLNLINRIQILIFTLILYVNFEAKLIEETSL